MNANWTRRDLGRVSALGLTISLLTPLLPAQTVRRVPRVGLLIGDLAPLINAFDEEISRLGFVDGENIHIIRRLPRANSNDSAVFARELAGMNLDVVVAGALPFAIQLRDANPALPMVIAFGPALVSNGFAESMERPNRSATGVDELPPGITSRRLELLKMAAPRSTRIGLLSTTPGTGAHEIQVADAEAAARRLGVEVTPYRAADLQQLQEALERMARDGVDGLLSFQGGLSVANRQMIVEFAAKHHLPSLYQSETFVEAGGLMAWAPDQPEQMRVAVRYVGKILQGARPGDLPITYPEKYFLFLNSKAASRIGLEIPPAIRALAYRVYS